MRHCCRRPWLFEAFRGRFEDLAGRTAAFAHEAREDLALHRKINAVERCSEGPCDGCEWHTILRALGSCDARFHASEVEIEHFVETRLGVRVGSEQTLFTGVALDQIDERTAAGQLEVVQ